MHSVYIEYVSADIPEPLFVAGTFGDPPWRLQQMQCVAGGDGLRRFVASVWVEPGRVYQYKFRPGSGDRWILDEKRPIGQDDAGNSNNLLRVPESYASDGVQGEASKFPKGRSKSEIPRSNRWSEPSVSTPKQRPEARMAASPPRLNRPLTAGAPENAGIADYIDNLKPLLQVSDSEDEDDLAAYEEPLSGPMFAHESFGGNACVDDGFDHGCAIRQQSSRSASRDYSFDDQDLNDPTLERFPSETSSILDAINKIDSNSSCDHSHFQDFLRSTCFAPRRGSVDSSESILTSGSLSPTSTRKRDHFMPRMGFGRTKSTASLGSIAEEDGKAADGNTQHNSHPVGKHHNGRTIRG